MPIQNRDYYGAVQRGRFDADQAVRRKQVNALGQLDLEQAQRFNALAQDPNATAEQFAREGRSDIGNTLLNYQGHAQKQQQMDSQRLFTAAQYALQSDRPKELIATQFPELAAMNPNFAQETDESVKAQMQQLMAKYGSQIGVGPAKPLPPIEQMSGPNGSTILTRGEDWKVVEQPRPDKPQAFFVPLSPEEVRAAGLPAGTAAQRNIGTGQINVMSKRDATANLSQKDATTAKQKLVTVQLAKQQLERIRARFEKLKGSMAAGAFGQGRLPTEAGKSFDAAVDQMRSTLTALTRTPGVGAMSDYETKLDQAKFPARTNYESVTEEQIQAIDDQLTLIDRGYRSLLEGSGPVQEDAPEPDISQLSDEDLLRALSGG
jgi:ribosomal protein S13